MFFEFTSVATLTQIIVNPVSLSI